MDIEDFRDAISRATNELMRALQRKSDEHTQRVLELDREIRARDKRIAELERFARDVRDGYDHDENAHRHNNPPACRCCCAEVVLGREPSDAGSG